MPATIASTTTRALEPAVIEAIAGITPSHPVDGDGGWAPATDNRIAGQAGLRVRAFEIRIAPGRTVEGGLTGNGDTEKEALLDVVVDYRGIDTRDLGTLVEHDQWDLYERLEDRLDPVIPGLTAIADPIGPRPDAEAETRIVHQFTIQYLKARS